MELLNELLPSISWSLIGFLLGWLVGREMLFVHRMKEPAMEDTDDTKGGPGQGSSDEHTHKSSRTLVLGIIISLLAVFTVLQGSYYTYETQKKATCQAQFNADFAKVIGLRAQWADEDKAAELKLFRDLLAAKPGSGSAILSEYLAATDRTDKLRRENPLPKLEDRNC